jgi:hypothetical protein
MAREHRGTLRRPGTALEAQSPRGARGVRAALAAQALLAACLVQAPGCCLTRPPDAKTLVAAGSAGWRTPEAAFETFRVAFGADLPELEYRSLSLDFRRREGVSYQSYRVARERILEENPLLALLTRAEVVESRPVDGLQGRTKKHRLVVQAAGRRFGVELVREDRYQICSGTTLLADGTLDFGRALRFRESPEGWRTLVDLLIPGLDVEGIDLSSATSFLVEQTWKIDRFMDAPAP